MSNAIKRLIRFLMTKRGNDYVENFNFIHTYWCGAYRVYEWNVLQ